MKKGGLVNKKQPEASKHIQSKLTAGPEIDYSPKTYTPRAQLVFGAKVLLIAGIIMLLFWLIEKNL
jgi:hypothetical protein